MFQAITRKLHLLRALAVLSMSLAQAAATDNDAAAHTTMNLGERQDLLSPTAAYAIEKGDLQLLKALKTAGWNPALPMRFHVVTRNHTPLTYAARFGNVEIVRWLTQSCGISQEARNGYNDRPIEATMDVRHEKLERGGDKIVALLAKDSPPSEEGAIRALACELGGDGYLGPCNFTINNRPPDGAFAKLPLWVESAGRDMQRYRDYADGLDKPKKGKSMEQPPQPDKPQEVSVEWKMISTKEYRFKYSIGDDSGFGGSGGAEGVFRFRFGYWICTVEKDWDV